MRVRLSLFLVALAALCAHAAWYAATWTDDAYITFRYARRFGMGEGMTFNPGEHFEGITNLGWALVLAPFADGDLLTAAQALGVLAGAGALALLATWGRRLSPVATACALASFVAPAWIPTWMMQGLETAAVTLLLTAGWVTYLWANESGNRRAYVVAGVCIGLGPWLRPDLAALPVVLLAWHVWTRPLNRSLVWAIAPIVASAFLLVALKLVWFGDILPNTFHLKVDHFPPDRGLRYLWSYFTRPSPWLPLLSLAAVVRAGFWAAHKDDRAVPGLVFGAWLLIGTLQNGDFMPNYRFYTPAWPAAAAAIGLLVQEGVARIRWWGAPVLSFGVLGVMLAPASRVFLIDRLDSAPSEIANLRPKKETAFFLPWKSSTWGVALADNVPFPAAWAVVNAGPTDTVAYTELGLISYLYDGAVVDLLGLTDPVIAGRNGEDLDAKWAYIEGRVNWLIVDTHLPAWNRWASRLARSNWTVVDGCTSVWVFKNPALAGKGPTSAERTAAVQRAARRASRHTGLQTAINNELEHVRAEGATTGGACGSRERRLDPARAADPKTWPEAKEEQTFTLVKPEPSADRPEPKVDPDSEPPPTDKCVRARAAAARAWTTAADAWSERPEATAPEARRAARSAARAAARADALEQAEEAIAIARRSSGPAADASAAAMRATEATEVACRR